MDPRRQPHEEPVKRGERQRFVEAVAGGLFLAREQNVRASPTLIFNEGRQRLTGNVGYRVIEANVRELLQAPAGGQSWC